MKLKEIHLFLILLGVLLLSNLGFIIKEGLEEVDPEKVKKAKEDGVKMAEILAPAIGTMTKAAADGWTEGTGGGNTAGGEYKDAEKTAAPLNETMVTDKTLEDSGEDGKYILKSSIVPPVCPKCPEATVCPRQKPCPPCPACARCPEQPFTCKKVPDYKNIDSKQLPKPVLTNFSKFSS